LNEPPAHLVPTANLSDLVTAFVPEVSAPVVPDGIRRLADSPGFTRTPGRSAHRGDGNQAENPFCFSGFVVRSDVAAAGLLAVATARPPGTPMPGLDARLVNRDPVVPVIAQDGPLVARSGRNTVGMRHSPPRTGRRSLGPYRNAGGLSEDRS
jgi:hypothetical protein